MAHVSKIPMNDSDRRRIAGNLMKTLFSDSGRGKTILPTLLTKTERVMLAKRLAVIIMIEKDYSSYEIWKKLKISTSTIKRYELAMDAGLYDPILRAVRMTKKGLSFLELIELIAAAGLPSIAGPRGQKRLKALRARAGS